MTYICTIILFLPLFSCSSDLDATRRKTTMHCIQQAKKADHPWYLYKIWPIMDIKSHRSGSMCRDIWCWGTSTHSFQLLVRMCTSLSDSKHHRNLFGFDYNPTITPYNLGIAGWMQMFEHPCQEGDEARIRCFGAQRVEPSWKLSGFTSCHKWQLKEF